jgi:undecaprenyl pyrophosphate synthase
LRVQDAGSRHTLAGQRPDLAVVRRRLRSRLRGLSLPRHVAIIMDGNRRWALRHGFDDLGAGHGHAAEHLGQVLGWCAAYCGERHRQGGVIRTSGEQRLGGFLLWQTIRSDLYFCEVDRPGFRQVDFLRALHAYAARFSGSTAGRPIVVNAN